MEKAGTSWAEIKEIVAENSRQIAENSRLMAEFDRKRAADMGG